MQDFWRFCEADSWQTHQQGIHCGGKQRKQGCGRPTHISLGESYLSKHTDNILATF